MQYYIISYFLKKFTFINTEVEIAVKLFATNIDIIGLMLNVSNKKK